MPQVYAFPNVNVDVDLALVSDFQDRQLILTFFSPSLSWLEGWKWSMKQDVIRGV
jgi:hypothetical protein